jgi:hypothetical protein
VPPPAPFGARPAATAAGAAGAMRVLWRWPASPRSPAMGMHDGTLYKTHPYLMRPAANRCALRHGGFLQGRHGPFAFQRTLCTHAHTHTHSHALTRTCTTHLCRRAKYSLQTVVRTMVAKDDEAFHCVYQMEDASGECATPEGQSCSFKQAARVGARRLQCEWPAPAMHDCGLGCWGGSGGVRHAGQAGRALLEGQLNMLL